MILATRHVGIVVHDMERCLRFWMDTMGMRVAVDFWETGAYIDALQHLDGVNLHMIKLKAPDGSMIELLKDEAHPTAPPERNQLCDRGIRHVAFTVADADAAWRALRDYGCPVLSRPLAAPDGKARVFFARDPEGNLLELVEMLEG
jgi:catechol 2,3-dioxygenase-like lactoylglutathione lyase family enzyme